MNCTNDINNTSLLHKLLIAPEYSIYRHLLLLSVIAVISLNQAFMTFLNGLDVLGYRIYLQAGLTFASYILVGYFNFFVMLPRYLLKRRYARYIGMLAISIFLLVIFQTREEYCVLKHFQIVNHSYNFPNIFISMLSAFALIFLSLSGPAMTILLKYWLTENKKMGELEKRHVQSEVERASKSAPAVRHAEPCRGASLETTFGSLRHAVATQPTAALPTVRLQPRTGVAKRRDKVPEQLLGVRAKSLGYFQFRHS